MKLSIIIPVYNEKKNIEKVLAAVQAAPVMIEKEIIVVDDFSSDGTRDILENKFSNIKNIRLVYQAKNSGKGYAIRTGLKEVTGDIVLIQDADLEYSVQDYPALIEPILSGEAQVVYGSRFTGKISGMNRANWYANKILAISANLLFGLNITDEATAYKVFKTEVIKNIPLRCQRFEFCPEITAKVAKKGIKIYEVPINYHGRQKIEGKKIGLKDGFEAIWTLIKFRVKN